MENKQYWEQTYKDVLDGVVFRFKKMTPVEHISLVTKNNEFERLDGKDSQYFIHKCLQNTLWSKDNQTWNPLVDFEGNARLPELESNMAVALDLFYYFKKDVLLPVFTESKTFQRAILELSNNPETEKNSEEQKA